VADPLPHTAQLFAHVVSPSAAQLSDAPSVAGAAQPSHFPQPPPPPPAVSNFHAGIDPSGVFGVQPLHNVRGAAADNGPPWASIIKNGIVVSGKAKKLLEVITNMGSEFTTPKVVEVFHQHLPTGRLAASHAFHDEPHNQVEKAWPLRADIGEPKHAHEVGYAWQR